MNVTFTYSYNHSIVPPRCRLPRTVREHDGLITVEIREIPPEQAPVAIISSIPPAASMPRKLATGRPMARARGLLLPNQVWREWEGVCAMVRMRSGSERGEP